MSGAVLLSSALKICNNFKQVVIYGFNHCKYLQIRSTLRNLGTKLASTTTACFEKIFDYQVGSFGTKQTTLEGGSISMIDYDDDRNLMSRKCKSGLVNIVFENYKRKKLGQELIPVLFCIDSSKKLEEDAETPLTAENLASKEENFNSLITFKELRRAYKLCKEFDDEEIRAVAEETFKFVKVTVKEDKESLKKFQKGNLEDCILEQVKAPWDDPKWAAAWDKRKKAEKTPGTKKHSWRKQLHNLKEEFLHSSKLSSSQSSSSSSSSSSSLSQTTFGSNSFAIPMDQIPSSFILSPYSLTPSTSPSKDSSSDDEFTPLDSSLFAPSIFSSTQTSTRPLTDSSSDDEFTPLDSSLFAPPARSSTQTVSSPLTDSSSDDEFTPLDSSLFAPPARSLTQTVSSPSTDSSSDDEFTPMDASCFDPAFLSRLQVSSTSTAS